MLTETGMSFSTAFSAASSTHRAAVAVHIVLVVLVGAALTACGRPATEDDCNKVVEKNVEVQLKKMNITDPSAIESEKGRIRASLKDSIKQCVGRRVTDGMMRCVEQSKTPEDLDKCTR